jgi:hypothetical protein
MKRKPFQGSLIVTIIALILLFPACPHTSDLAGTRLLSADLSFENPDENDILSYQLSQPKAFVSTDSSFTRHAGDTLPDRVAHFILLASFPDQEASLLRC